MALKFKYKSKEEIPAEHLNFYVERDGAFVLDAEGAVEKSRVDEFRNNNVTLTKRNWMSCYRSTRATSRKSSLRASRRV